MATKMPRSLWFESPAGIKMYAGAGKDSDGWVVRLFDQTGNQISPIVFRVTYETLADEMSGDLDVDVVADLMYEMRRQVMAREIAFMGQPVKGN